MSQLRPISYTKYDPRTEREIIECIDRLDSTRDYSRIALRSFQLSIWDRPLPSRESLSFPYCGFQMKLYLRTVSMRQNLERRKWFVRPQPVAGVTSLSRNESKPKVSASPLISFAERLRKRVAPKKKRNSRMQFRFH